VYKTGTRTLGREGREVGTSSMGRGDVKYRGSGVVNVAKVQGKCEIYRMYPYTTEDSTIVTIFYFV